MREGNVEYLIKWKHFDSPEWDTWEPSENLENVCPEMINEFEEKEVVKLMKQKVNNRHQKMRYEVEKIIDKKIAGVEFLVKWKKYKTKTWEPEANLEHVSKKLKQIIKINKDKYNHEDEEQEAPEESFANVLLVAEEENVDFHDFWFGSNCYISKLNIRSRRLFVPGDWDRGQAGWVK